MKTVLISLINFIPQQHQKVVFSIDGLDSFQKADTDFSQNHYKHSGLLLTLALMYPSSLRNRGNTWFCSMNSIWSL